MTFMFPHQEWNQTAEELLAGWSSGDKFPIPPNSNYAYKFQTKDQINMKMDGIGLFKTL